MGSNFRVKKVVLRVLIGSTRRVYVREGVTSVSLQKVYASTSVIGR